MDEDSSLKQNKFNTSGNGTTEACLKSPLEYLDSKKVTIKLHIASILFCFVSNLISKVSWCRLEHWREISEVNWEITSKLSKWSNLNPLDKCSL